MRVSERMYAKYFVAQKSKTYRFRLTIWDPKNKDRKDYDFVNVDIMGGMAVSYIIHLIKSYTNCLCKQKEISLTLLNID